MCIGEGVRPMTSIECDKLPFHIVSVSHNHLYAFLVQHLTCAILSLLAHYLYVFLYKDTLLYCITHINIQKIIHNSNMVSVPLL